MLVRFIIVSVTLHDFFYAILSCLNFITLKKTSNSVFVTDQSLIFKIYSMIVGDYFLLLFGNAGSNVYILSQFSPQASF